MTNEPIDHPGGDDSPSLSSGAILGHYQVTTCIGYGGMGEVYRARDRHLERDVAIKVLRRHILSRPRSRIDFRHEAEALSRLNHPNIATVYDFDTQDDVDFLVMEYVNGESLADRVRRGPLAHGEWVGIGREICDALAAAHAHGIIHRDLKPRNVFLDEWGHVKVLDFGLAKLIPEYVDSSATTQTESRTGRIVGTPPYMAPEQLRGERVDARTDIYALGTTLYELATGSRAFSAPTHAELVACVLERTPARPRSLRTDLSPKLERVIVRAMQREPRDRYQSAGELSQELSEAATVAPSAPRARSVFWVAAALALLLAASWPLLRRQAATESPTQSPIVRDPIPRHSLSLSPDGEWISYVDRDGGGQSLWRTPRAGGASERLLSSLGTVYDHCWSPDGQRIAVVGERSGGGYVQILPAFGGVADSPIELDPDDGWPSEVSWIGDRLFLGRTRNGLWTIDSTSGASKLLLDGLGLEGPRSSFSVCAIGDHALFTVTQQTRGQIYVADLSTGKPELVRRGAIAALFAGDDCRRFIYSSGEPGQLELWLGRLGTNDAQRLTFGSGDKYALSSSRDGRLVAYRAERHQQELWLLDRSEGQRPVALTSGLQNQLWPSGQNDSPFLVFQRTPPLVGNSLPILRSEIVAARLEGQGLADPRAVAASGGLASVDASGLKVAFVEIVGDKLTLQTLEVDTRRKAVASEYYPLTPFYGAPFEMIEQHHVWSDDDSRLLFFESMPSRSYQLRSWSRKGVQVLYTAPDDSTTLNDLCVSRDGLAYAIVERSGDAQESRVLRFDRTDSSPRIVFEAKTPRLEDRVLVRGFRSDGSLLVLESSVFEDEWASERVRLHSVAADGSTRSLGVLESAYAGTARYDDGRDVLYFTARDAEQQLIIRAYDLGSETGTLIAADPTGTGSFGAVALVGERSLIVPRREELVESWLLDFGDDRLSRAP